MPIDAGNYNHRGAGNYGIVIRCPRIVADRLIYFDHNAERGTWVIRDFVTGRQLSNSNSELLVAEIEADANYDEYPPWFNAVNIDEWRVYLTLRTTAVFQVRNASNAEPNPDSGDWQPL